MQIIIQDNKPLTTASIVSVSITMGDLLRLLGNADTFTVHTPSGPAVVNRINSDGQDQFIITSQVRGQNQVPSPGNWAHDVAATLLPIDSGLPNTFAALLNLRAQIADELLRAASRD